MLLCLALYVGSGTLNSSAPANIASILQGHLTSPTPLFLTLIIHRHSELNLWTLARILNRSCVGDLPLMFPLILHHSSLSLGLEVHGMEVTWQNLVFFVSLFSSSDPLRVNADGLSVFFFFGLSSSKLCCPAKLVFNMLVSGNEGIWGENVLQR